MKKRSLLTLSLVSLVGLVGCNKQAASGAAAKCSAAAFDDVISAQFGLFMVDALYAPVFENQAPYGYAEIKFSLEYKGSGYFGEDGETVSEKLKGSFIAAFDASSNDWLVDSAQEYSEEDLELYEYILSAGSQQGFSCPVGNQSWAYLVNKGSKLGELIDSLYNVDPAEGESSSATFTTKPSYTLNERYWGEDEVEIGENVVSVNFDAKYADTVAFADKYGFCTYSLSTASTTFKGLKDEQNPDLDYKAANGSESSKYEFSIRYFNVEEPEEDLGE